MSHSLHMRLENNSYISMRISIYLNGECIQYNIIKLMNLTEDGMRIVILPGIYGVLMFGVLLASYY